MRTVFGTTFGIRPADLPRATDRISEWIHGWYKRRGLTLDLQASEEPGEVSAQAATGHDLRVRTRHPKVEPTSHLIEITWSYPDDYDSTLRWNVLFRLAANQNHAVVVFQLAISGSEYTIRPVELRLGAPKIINELTRMDSVTISGYAYSSIPEMVHAHSVSALCSLLRDKARPYPVLVVSKDLQTEASLVDVDRLAEGVAGLMRVFELADKWAAYQLTDELGKTMSCYGGAVRIYWPQFGTASSVRHFAWMPNHLRALASTDEFITQAFKLVADASSYRLIEPPLIADLRNEIEAEQRADRRAEAPDDALALLEQLIQTEEALKAQEARTKELEAENITLQQNLDAIIGLNIAAPEARASSATLVDDDDEPADVLAALRSAQQRCSHLIFLPSAEDSARDSPYKTPERALQALEAIDDVAGLWAISVAGGKAAGPFKQLFRERGFDYKDDISQTTKGKWGSEYTATYDGRLVDVAPHITIGAKQADTCLSIHMYWDRDKGKAVIAHVGRHKTNTKS